MHPVLRKQNLECQKRAKINILCVHKVVFRKIDIFVDMLGRGFDRPSWRLERDAASAIRVDHCIEGSVKFRHCWFREIFPLFVLSPSDPLRRPRRSKCFSQYFAGYDCGLGTLGGIFGTSLELSCPRPCAAGPRSRQSGPDIRLVTYIHGVIFFACVNPRPRTVVLRHVTSLVLRPSSYSQSRSSFLRFTSSSQCTCDRPKGQSITM